MLLLGMFLLYYKKPEKFLQYISLVKETRSSDVHARREGILKCSKDRPSSMRYSHFDDWKHLGATVEGSHWMLVSVYLSWLALPAT